MNIEYEEQVEKVAKNGDWIYCDYFEDALIRKNNEKIERWMIKQYLLGNKVNNLFACIKEILPCDTSGDMQTYYYSKYTKYINEKYK